MAKSDSFFIRHKVITNATDFTETSIDLGAYVDALGKSVLRIHGLAVKYGDGQDEPNLAGGGNAVTAYQLTTQTQSALVQLDDKSLIASGTLHCSNASSVPGALTLMSEHSDIGPQMWRNGYLVGVEQIYMAVDQTADVYNEISIVLECTVETLSQNAAMALALSQQ